MSDIKFRLWYADEAIMTGAFTLQLLAKWLPMDATRYKALQFIGLQDKNGKDIYEGDVVNSTIDPANLGANEYWVIQRCGAAFYAFNKHGYARRISFAFGEAIFQPYDRVVALEVIGNAYQNPEMIVGFNEF